MAAIGILAVLVFPSIEDDDRIIPTNFSAKQNAGQDTNSAAAVRYKPIGEIVGLSDDELGRQDLALLNLRCAEGLAGSEDLDIDICLQTLDRWAAHVRSETARHHHRFLQNPEEYNNSIADFRVLFLIVVLQDDFNVRYNPDRIDEPDFTDSRDLFLHGLLTGHGGTCVSMPTLYVAVGRRLGYPMKLVFAKRHVFARWDDPATGERFNIEATGRGFSRLPDEYYRSGDRALTEEELASGVYLTSLSPRQELAAFLAPRGHCLLDNGRAKEALEAYSLACELFPENPNFAEFRDQARAACTRQGIRLSATDSF